MRILPIFLLFAAPSLAQEVFVHPIPPGCISVTVPASPTVAGKVTITCPKLHIVTPVILPKATENSPYSANLATLARPTGGVAPYTYLLSATPAPPAWLKLSLAGMVTGTPTATGTVIFSFSVSDSSAKLTQAGQGSFNVRKAHDGL